MHLWFPLPEGYSSSFVRAVLNQFAPSSQSVLDPFCGTGTTVVESSRMGKRTYYCEVNPALQFLIEVKTQALLLDNPSREHLRKSLCELASSYGRLLSSVRENLDLDLSYSRVFGSSLFFSPQAFRKVLKARTVIDKISYKDPVLADFLTLATLASLVPASLVKRAGDLRFRRPKEMQSIVPLESLVCEKLTKMASDLSQLQSTTCSRPLLICEDARRLSTIPRMNLDAVVTSPPYVNGTNYFRNTKLELWFLRTLHSSEDLRRFRNRAVTAGINDVTMPSSQLRIDCTELESVLGKLKEKSYDRRIPVLVEEYFADLKEIFGGLAVHLRKDGLLAVDIGDSVFAGVHVPTDKILVDILQRIGYRFESEWFLRTRQSHSGSKLRQVLLVLRKIGDSALIEDGDDHFWEEDWEKFKHTLPHQEQPFAKRNWGHPLHSLCSYQGKMKPSLAHHLIRIFVRKGGVMLDPFAGVGTIPFEAALRGVKAFGFEISPAARFIAAAKVGRPRREICLDVTEQLETYIRESVPSAEELTVAQGFGFNRKLSEFYHEDTLREIVLARKYFKERIPANPSECLVMASLLHILHGNRPYCLSRRSHPITPFAPTGPFEYRPLMPRLRNKVTRGLTLEYPLGYVEGAILDQDATSWWPAEIDELDAIVTSPPFFDSTRFYMTNWLRLWFSGWDQDDFKDKPKRFIDERQKEGFAVYENIFRQARERLRQGGVVVLHLGGSRKCDMAQQLSEVASSWFKVADVFRESVAHCESHGIHDKGTVTEHQYLILI